MKVNIHFYYLRCNEAKYIYIFLTTCIYRKLEAILQLVFKQMVSSILIPVSALHDGWWPSSHTSGQSVQESFVLSLVLVET